MTQRRGIEFHQPSGGNDGREGAVSDVVPTTSADARGIAEPALDFVSQGDREDQFAPRRSFGFAYGEGGGDVIAGMRGLPGEISVVVVKVTNEAAIGEGGPIHGRAVGGPEQRRASLGRECRSHLSREHTRVGVPRAEGAPK